MRIKIDEMDRASTGDIIEIEGKVKVALKASENEYGWSQFIVVKEATGELGCWLNLEEESDKLGKGTLVRVKGKVSEVFKDKKGNEKRSLSSCAYELVGEVETKETKARPKELDREGYWGDNWGEKLKLDIKRLEWEKMKFVRANRFIVVECSVKAATEMVCAKVIKPHELYATSEKIMVHIYREVKNILETSKPKEKSKEKPKVEEEDERPATEAQKRVIFGYEDDDGIHKKGIVESRFITKNEVNKIGDKNKLSFDKASHWIGKWWGEEGEVGERAKREMDAMPEEEAEPSFLTKEEPLVKRDENKKSSLKKDLLIDDINALRRENFLMDDAKFEEEFEVSGNLEKSTEKALGEIKKKFKDFHPKDWDKE